MSDPASRPVRTVRVQAGCCAVGDDLAAMEEPLEVRVDGRSFAVIMRTPGADRPLAAGFLFAEGIVHRPADVAGIEIAPAPHPNGPSNRLNVRLSRERAAELGALARRRRRVVTSSSCGLCGRSTIESLRVEAPRLDACWQVDAELVTGLPAVLAQSQRVFGETGGLHAAGLFIRDGRLALAAEDVGRHNAVDKVVGEAWLAGRLPLADDLLLVSGRASFEIVQKAFLAGIPLVAAVSAPSSLAIELAHTCGITLLGFVRGERFNVYAHPERIKGLTG